MELRAKELKSQETMLETKVLYSILYVLLIIDTLTSPTWSNGFCHHQAVDLKRRRKKLGEEEDEVDRQIEVGRPTFSL